MARGKHYGAFAKGFTDSLVQMMKLKMTMDLYKARADYYERKGYGKPGTGINSPDVQGAINKGKADYGQGGGEGGGGGGGGGVNTSASLDANQREAYQAARGEGLSDNAARAFVANTTGEGLAVPGDKHLDPNGKQNAFGIVQWDDQRAAAIKQQFGKMPNEMSVGDQTRAAIWEMKTNPRFADAWKTLNSDASSQDMVKSLVRNYEQPKNPDVAINQRLQHLGNLSTDLSGGGTQVAATGGKDTTGKIAQTDGYQHATPSTVAANSSPNGEAPKAFIMHHTVIQGSPQDIVDFWKKQGKGYGAQYIMDRDGVVHDTQKEFGYSGTNEILDDKKHGLTNGNVVGMEIIAKDDKDVTPAQAKSAASFVKTNYPTTPVYGHGQVNPGHKEATEGMTAVNAVNADRGVPTKGPNAGKPAKTAQAGDGSYQVAGDTDIALTPEQAAKAKADLEAHRAAPDTDTGPASSNAPAANATDTALRAEAARRADPRDLPPDQQRARELEQDRLTRPPSTPDTDKGPGSSGGPGLPLTPTSRGPTGDPASGRDEANRAAAMVGKPDLPLPARSAPEQAPGPEDPEVIARQAHGQGTLPPPRMYHSLQPSDMPSSGVGVSAADTYGPPQRTGAPPNVGITPSSVPDSTPQMGPEGGGRTTLPLAYSHMPAPQNEKGETAPGSAAPSNEANKPAPNAQPVSSPALPSNPQGNSSGPGWTTIERPNIDQAGGGRSGGGRQQSQMGVLDLSHLWGPNPPLSERQQQQSSPAPPPAPAASSPLPSRLPDDMADNASLGMDIMGSAKGGPIGFRQGGAIPTRPTMKFAAAGAVPYTSYQDPATAPPTMGMFNAGAYANPNMQLWRGGEQWLGSQSTSPYSAQAAETTPGGVQADINALPANLQAWYNQQNADAMAGGGGGSGNQWYYNPASMPAAPAATTSAATTAATPAATPTVAPTLSTTVSPAASTTITDPTTTTTTGAPGLSNAIQAKSYDPNVDQQTGAGFANVSNTGGTNYSVGSNDLLKTTSDNTISGSDDGSNRTKNQTILSAKGGAIPARPMTKFATGGTAGAANPAYTAILQGTYNGPTSGGGWMGTPQSQLAPNQQTWATGQQGIWNQIDQATAARDPTGRLNYMNQLTMMPNAVWPTAAASAAPTPLNEPPPSASTSVTPAATITDPTTTTTTGAPGLPNSIQAKSYDPNVDQQTGAGFANTSNTGGTNYSVGADDLLKQNNQGQISGSDNSNTTILSRKGGPITQRVNRYDDGGGVSGTIAGMPPGLSGGGQQATPPIYYNPATYAAAGAPVGKGVSATSAPTFGAGAIPSLPMARGGVVGFADGGDVGGDDALNTMQSLDFADAREDGGEAPAAGPPATTFNSAGEPTSDVNPNDYLSTSAPASDHVVPPDPTTPQIHDDAGNPSKGLIAAIGDGLHWLGEHLGLVGGAQAAPIAANPQTQTNRQNFSGGQNVGDMTPEGYDELKKVADPGGQLNEGYRNLAGLEAGYKFALSKGDDQTASKLAAAYLHYSVNLSQNLSAKAQDALYNGDLKKSVDYTNQALQAVPDGRNIHVELSPDGSTVKVTGSTLTGQQLWQKYGSAPEILERASSLGRSGKLQWDALESQAAKYDSTFANAQKARTANATGQAKEDADKAAQAQANEAIARLGPQFGDGSGDQSGGQSAPASAPVTPALPGPGAAPATTTVNATPTPAPSPGKTPDTTSAQPASPPPTSDENQGQGPTVANADKGAGLPAQPDSADLPASDAQNVDLEHDKGYQAIVANTTPKYFASDGRPLVGGRPMNRPPMIDAVTLKSYAPQVQAAYNERWKEYTQAVQENQKALSLDVDGQRRDYGVATAAQVAARSQAHSDASKLQGEQFSQGQQNEREKFSQSQQNEREAAQIKAKQESERAALEAQAVAPRTDTHKVFALEPDENGKMTGKQPQDYYKDGFGLNANGDIDPNLRETGYRAAFPNRNEQDIMNNALINGYRYTKDAEAPAIAEALRGVAAGDYTAVPTEVPNDSYGQRYAITITRPSDGAVTTVILPRDDWLNLQRVHQASYQRSSDAAVASAKNTPIQPSPSNAGDPTVRAPPTGQSAGTPISKMFGWQRGGPIHQGIPSQPGM